MHHHAFILCSFHSIVVEDAGHAHVGVAFYLVKLQLLQEVYVLPAVGGMMPPPSLCHA